MKCTLAILCLFASWLAAKAQPDDLNFINFSSKNGLSSNTVNFILKDRMGYMWFATEDGLNRFDGSGFKVYNHNISDTNSIGTNQIRVLFEDSQGQLWVGTNRCLSLYDRQRDRFHNYNIANGTAVRSICADGGGGLWLGSYAGLIHYNPADHHAKYYTGDPARSDWLLSNTVTCVYKDSKKRLWVGTNKGLYLYQPGTDNFLRLNKGTDPELLADSVVRTIAEDKYGHIWFGTNNGGLNRLEADGRRLKNFKAGKTDPQTLSSDLIYSVASDSSGRLWIGTEEGLNIFDQESGTVQRVSEDPRNKYSFKGRSIRSIFIDDHGIYWVGTNQDGINKYDRNLPFFNLVQYNPFDPHGLSSPKITSFAEGAGGLIYVGTDGGGLNVFDRAKGWSRHIEIGEGKKSTGLIILSLERRGDDIWIGTFHQGVYVLNTLNNSVRQYKMGKGNNDLPHNDIFCIKKDRKGNMWLGTNGKGICMYDPRSGAFQRFGDIITDAGSQLLSRGFIRAIEEDSAGNIVVGTVGSGVALYDPSRHTCRQLTRTNTGLPLDEVTTLHIDRNNAIWAGTPSAGLCLLDVEHKRFVNYSGQQGLANVVIYKVLADEAGRLWVSTNKGISCLDRSASAFKNYTSDNGLQQSSFNPGAGLKASSGRLFFGGIEGFNYFQPADLKNNRNIPIVVFTNLKIGGRNIVPGKQTAIKDDIAVVGEIRLDYKQNFSVDFTALDYTTPGEDRFMYQLEGLDKAWIDIGVSRTAVFSNLYPQTYTLKVRAKNCNGAWVTPVATIRIYVKPPFWLTGYAYVFYILLAGAILWGIRYRAIRKLKNKFALEQERLRLLRLVEQERLEAERLHEFDQLKIKFLTNLSHEFRTPISLIIGPIDRLQEREADPDKQGQLNMVRRNARRLLNLVNQLLDFRKLVDQELKLSCTEGDIVPFLEEAAESFRDIAECKQIEFTFRTGLNHFYTCFDKDKIERVLFNLLGNAFKFTGSNGKISLEIKQAHPSKELLIIISDTGCGIAADDQHRIFDRFFQGKARTGVINKGSGIGLSITKDFVRLHGGTISVESSPGKGSIFTISLPLQNLPVSVNEAPLVQGLPVKHSPSSEASPAVIPAADRLTVLLVEDNEDFRSYLKDNLQHYYRIIEAADGMEGWQKALSGRPDVIVSDITMPNMDGIGLSLKIRSEKRTSHIPIILLTALTGEAYQLKGLETGASDYLTKPFSFEILNLKIRNLVSLNQRLKDTYSRRLHIETPPVQVQSGDEKLMLMVTRYIESNLDSASLSVEDLCRHAYLSHASLYRKIVDITGETPVEFIRSIRLNKAADLLERSHMKMAEIGYAVGFTTPNYFTRAFKAKFNVSPSEYAALKRKQVS